MDIRREDQKDADGSSHLLEEENLNHLPLDTKMVNENEDHDDFTEDKLIPEDSKLNSSKEANEVKFISSDSQNGDAKIDIENVKSTFAGMGKEELMRFANDPFWIRMRWFLFILFWLLWVGMLAGAIAIIVMAPKCAPPPPLKWSEQTSLYQVYVRSYQDGDDPQDGVGDLKGLLSKLDYIHQLGVKGIIISPVLKSSNQNTDDTVEDFKLVDPLYGSLDDFDALTTAMKSKGMHLVMNLVPNHSSNKHEWFLKSEAKEEPYIDYYVWAQGAKDTNGVAVPPNNWKSIYGGSAWEWSEKRQEFYLHQFSKDQPDLNFHNEDVIEEFKDILKFWISHGVSGFEFDKLHYLLEDKHLEDEKPGDTKGTTHDQYEFFNHKHTSNLPGVFDILVDWKDAFSNFTDVSGMFSVITHSTWDSLFDYNEKSKVVDVRRNVNLFSSLQDNFTAADLNNTIEKWLQQFSSRHYWELGSIYIHRLASRFSPEIVDGLHMVTMLLPGTPITYYGDEIGVEDSSSGKYFSRAPMQWNNISNAGFSSITPWVPLSPSYQEQNVKAEQEAATSHLKVYEALVKARNNPSIMYGEYEKTVHKNVFIFTRFKSGNPGYIVAFNLGTENEEFDFKDLKNVSDKLQLYITSYNFPKGNELHKGVMTIPGQSAVVLTFVPTQN